MVRWPGNKESDEDVYHNLNEVYADIGGTYPVGQNRCWHSGIHIYSNTPVYPITNGTLIACRVNKEYIPVAMPDTITPGEHEKLGAEKYAYYHEEKTNHGITVCRLTDENAKDGITGGFMLLKHRMYLPVGTSGKDNELEFFSLYMNLLPYKEIPELKIYCNEFQFIEETERAIKAIRQAPFYIKWLFRGTPNKLKEYSCKEINGKKVFSLSRFKTTSNIYAGGIFGCEFENAPGCSVDISSVWVDVEKMKKRYIPKRDLVPVYSVHKPDNEPPDEYLLTSIKRDGTYFTTIDRHPAEEAWDYATGYFEVTVYPTEVMDSSRELGLYLPELNGYKDLGDMGEVNRKLGSNGYYECIKVDDEKILLKIKKGLTTEYIPHEFRSPQKGESDYKIVKLADFLRKLERIGWFGDLINYFDGNIDYNSEKIKIDMADSGKFIRSITIADGQSGQTKKKDGKLPVDSNKLVIILKNGVWSFDPEKYRENKNQIAFFYNNEQVFPYIDRDEIWDDLRSEPDSELSVYYVTPLAHLFPVDSYLEILKNTNGFSCSCLKSGKELLPCRISFGGEKKRVLVKASSLECEYAYGHVKANSDFFDKKIKGLPVYDDSKTPTDNTLDNMRMVLTEEKEFSLEQTDRFLENNAAEKRYAIIHEGAMRYVAIDDKSVVQIKAGIDMGKYGEDNTVFFPAETVGTGSLLGYPTPHKQYKNLPFYDFVVFFKDNAFMNNADGLHSDIFTIPEGVKIYKEKEKVQKIYMFPPGTVFDYKEEGKENGDIIYKLTIKLMEIYIFRADEKTEGKGAVVDKGTEIGEFLKIEVYDSYISYDEQNGEPNCDDKRLEPFAGAFEAIRDKIKSAKLMCVGQFRKGTEIEKRFQVDFSEYGDFKMPFWMAEKDIPAKMAKDEGKKNFTYARQSGNGELELNVYEENPLEAEFEEEEREGELSGALELRKAAGEKEGKDGKKYLGFRDFDNVFYAVESETRKENLLDWKKYFTLFEEENDNDIVCDSPIEDRLNQGRREPLSKNEMAKEKRKVACRHPLDWDREQYTVKKIKDGMFFGYEDRHKLLLEKMEAIEIWKHIKDQADIKQERNNFWYAHPVYFINHLDRAGLLNVNMERIIEVQDEVVKLKCLEKGAEGMYPEVSHASETTYCNQAAYLTIKAVDKNYVNFIGYNDLYKKNDAPWDLDSLDGTFKAKLGNYQYKNTTLWYEILEEQTKNSTRTGIHEVSDREAQELANMGYVVIAAWKNSPGYNKSPHYATVRPREVYNSKTGPMIANVGSKNDIMRAAEGFPGNGIEKSMLKETRWYYNAQQELNDSTDYLKEILGLKERK
jgi:hypothetical protein